jgi:UDP-2,3-diacylglucosamine hydrolase
LLLKKHIYFASDFHLGAPNAEESLVREKRIIAWLDSIFETTQELFLMGDLFDFWFEYKHVAPKGYIRFLGKLCEFTDAGIPVHVFIGNHDMWMFDYLEKEVGVKIHRENVFRTFSDKTFFLGHGDGLGPGDHGYKFIKKIFANKFCQWLFARLHPNFSFGMAQFWSRKSREGNGSNDEKFLGEENEWLAIYCKEQLQTQHHDFFIFGHRHLPINIKLNEQSRYVNLGEWINYNTYAVFNGEELLLKSFEN